MEGPNLWVFHIYGAKTKEQYIIYREVMLKPVVIWAPDCWIIMCGMKGMSLILVIGERLFSNSFQCRWIPLSIDKSDHYSV
mgnify:CR=1 FL=1